MRASPSVMRAALTGVMLLSGAAAGAASEQHRGPAPLTFGERVEAQRAIEQIYYRHRTGTKPPFDQAVPASLIEGKVRTYLRESAALDQYWRTPITRAALRRELRRIEAGTYFPDRLAEVRAALHDDDLLMETFVRATLANRLARAFLASDERAQEPVRLEAESVRRALADGRLDPADGAPHRGVLAVRQRPQPGSAVRPGSDPPPPRAGIDLDPAAYDRWRSALPARPGQVGDLIEGRDAFEFSVILSESDGSAEVALYTFSRLTWDEWWAGARDRFDEPSVQTAPAGEPETGSADAAAAGTSAPALAASCSLQDLWSGGQSEALPAARTGNTAIWTGSEMIIWGGTGSSSYLNSGARYDPLTDAWTQTATSNAPSPRTGHSAVWTGGEMIIWGGQTSTGGRYDPVTDTWRPTSTLNAPTARQGHSAVWTGSRMIVWGGDVNTNTGGRYDPATDTWSPTTTAGAPSARVEQTAVWTGSEMIVWGGSFSNTGGRYNPVADSWTPTSTLNAPSPRQAHTAVWSGGRMIIWGAFGSGFLPTGGRYDPATDQWQATTLAGAPTNRYAHSAVWTGTEMIVWGGTDFSHSPPNEVLNTGGRYNPVADAWIPTTTINAPSPRSQHTAVWTGDLMIIWGASGSTGGRYDPPSNSWTPTNDTRQSPGPRAGPSAVWTGAELIYWGGSTTAGARYDPLTDGWTPMTSANAPAARNNAPAVWTGAEMIVWGGGDYTASATGGRYNPVSDTWMPTTLANAPEARSGHTLVWTGAEMIVWGGRGSTFLATGGRYSPASNAWAATPAPGAPAGRELHTTVWTGSEMVVWGGHLGGGVDTDTGGRFNPSTGVWAPTQLTGAPVGREGHTAVWTGGLMIVFGGAYDRSGGRYDPAADSWSPATTLGAPVPFGHTVVWTGSEMIIWGGEGVNQYGYPTAYNTGARYDPLADVWTPTTLSGAPESRAAHVAFWTGRAMLVRGGYYYSGDVVIYRDDLSQRWYGNTTAAPPADNDADGVSECSDCDDHNPSAWGPPPEVLAIEFLGDGQTLNWPAPALTGGTALTYDTIRSGAAYDFVDTSAICVESLDGSDRTALDAAAPLPGEVFYYLVRARNGCPAPAGIGTSGTDSSGAPRAVHSCPWEM